MRFPRAPVEAFSENLAIANENSPDQWIRRNEADPAPRQIERPRGQSHIGTVKLLDG